MITQAFIPERDPNFDFLNEFISEEPDHVLADWDRKQKKFNVRIVQNNIILSSSSKIETDFEVVARNAIMFLLEQQKQFEIKYAQLQDQLALANANLFGTKSEKNKTSSAEDKDEPQTTAQPDIRNAGNIVEREKNVIEIESRRGRKPLHPDFPRQRIEYSLPEDKQVCPCCNEKLRPFGEEVVERLKTIPAQHVVMQYVRKKYVCTGSNCNFHAASEIPKSLLPGSSYGTPEFLAGIAVQRFQYGLPYYRQAQIFEQQNLPFNRTTLAKLMINTADRLRPLYMALRFALLNQDIIHADETTIQVLKEEGRRAESQSYMWLYRSNALAEEQIVIFEYQETRSGEHPKNFLIGSGNKAFKGYLVVDGYAGYNNILSVIRIGCMAHARRKFMDVIKSLPHGKRDTHASKALEFINKLYAIEKRLKSEKLQPDERYRVRQTESIPILNEFKRWLDEMTPQVIPKGLLGKAIQYTRQQWPALSSYVVDGRLDIDNNIAERDIKNFVIGRKNWLFSDTPDGAETNAIMYSLVNSAKANGLDPYKYLRFVIEHMPYLQTSKEVETLLPWNVAKTWTYQTELALSTSLVA